jgi:ABC-type multidrug transport system fused ATPase/permease subunit
MRRLFSFVEPGHRMPWVGVALLALIVTGLEVAAALLIFVVTRLVVDVGGPLNLPLLGDPRARWFRGLNDHQVLIGAMAIIAVFFLIRAAIVLSQSYLQARLAERTAVRISCRLFRGYLRMPYPFHLQRNSAELMRNVNEAVKDIVDYTLIPALSIASDALVIIGLGVALALTAPLAAALAAALFIPLTALLFWVVQPRIAALGRISHEMNGSALGVLQQSLHGFRDIVILDRREYFNDEYEDIREKIARTRYLREFLGDVPRVAMETGLILFVAVFLAAAVTFGGSSQESLAVLGLFAYAALRILPSMSRVVLQVNDLRFGATAAAAVYRDLAVVESVRPRSSLPAPDDAKRSSLTPHRQIRLDEVSYRYPGSDRDALVKVTLEIKQGETIGIVGPTGGGKSSLLDVILGLLPPSRGRVLVDDVDIQTNLGGWQRNLGVVPQTVYLLDTTLRRNIALGFDDDSIDEDRVREAVRLAQLETFVASLPSGLDTMVGERGIRISGGQRQRVAIARALYVRPTVLAFDEGTSALDAVTESELLEALEPLRRGRILLIVGHRLTTVRDCDRIVLVDSGRIADVGSFDELFERNAVFRRLASAPSEAAVGDPTRA